MRKFVIAATLALAGAVVADAFAQVANPVCQTWFLTTTKAPGGTWLRCKNLNCAKRCAMAPRLNTAGSPIPGTVECNCPGVSQAGTCNGFTVAGGAACPPVSGCPPPEICVATDFEDINEFGPAGRLVFVSVCVCVAPGQTPEAPFPAPAPPPPGTGK